MKKIAFALAIIGAFYLVPPFSPPTNASTVTSSLSVTATVDSACSVSTGALAFSDYAPLGINATAADNAEGTITLTCSQGTVAVIALNNGQNASGNQRMLTSGANVAPYSVYQDPSRTIAWSTGANSVALPAAPSSAPRTLSVYGQIAAGLSLAPGIYADTITVSVNF